MELLFFEQGHVLCVTSKTEMKILQTNPNLNIIAMVLVMVVVVVVVLVVVLVIVVPEEVFKPVAFLIQSN